MNCRLNRGERWLHVDVTLVGHAAKCRGYTSTQREQVCLDDG